MQRFINLQILVVLALGVIIISALVFGITYTPEYSNNTSNLTSFAINSYPVNALVESKPLQIENFKILRFESVSFQLINDWVIQEAFFGKNTQNLLCNAGKSNCTVYKVTKDNISFFVSNSSLTSVIPKDGYLLNNSRLNTLFGVKDFNTYSAILFVPKDPTELDPSIATEKSIIVEISGCILNNLCVNSSNISIEESENLKYINAFNELILSIRSV